MKSNRVTLYFVIGLLVVVALATAITGFRMRGYLHRDHHSMT